MSKRLITIASIGDISLQGRYGDRPNRFVFAEAEPVFRTCDLVVANLEGPLTGLGQPVPNKCTLRGSPAWAKIIKGSGISVVSLANNHIMDYGVDGLVETIKALQSAGLPAIGAGRNSAAAAAPILLTANGVRLAVFARSSVIVSSPCYAEDERAGVAFFEPETFIHDVRAVRKQVDFVVLVLHWGIEEYSFPSPLQVRTADKLFEGGVDIILGHHPHVLQGIRLKNGRLVSFSMGNFLFDEFEWSFVGADELRHTSLSKLSESNRKTGVLKIFCSATVVESVDFVSMKIESDGVVRPDPSPIRKREFESLGRPIGWPAYAPVWKAYALIKEWSVRIVPLIGGRLTWQRLKKIRFKHFAVALQTIKKSLKITAEKTTNPYE